MLVFQPLEVLIMSQTAKKRTYTLPAEVSHTV